MSVFRRRGRDGDGDHDVATPDDLERDQDGRGPDDRGPDDSGSDDLDGTGDTDPVDRGTPPPGREDGPWDVTEVADPGEGRVDLGGMWLPGREGLEVRVEADQASGSVVAVSLVLGDAALQVQPFAAPRTEGIWDDVRAEIRAGITKQGGTADEADGPLGTELRTKVQVRDENGRSGVQPARFVGVDGPRWFLRGVLTGTAAVEPGADADLLALFRDIVVVRGATPMAPREPIPLRLPGAAPEPGAVVPPTEDETLAPFERGPEITEIR